MKLITADLRTKLLAASRLRKPLAQPLVKFFTPDGNATWLISEMDPDGDTLFGLCDLGMGCPELGYVSLAEITALRGKMGLPVERDMYFRPSMSLVEYAEAAREKGAIYA